MTIDVAIIGMVDDQETVQIMAVYDSLESAESLEPGYDYYIDYTDNVYSPEPQIGSIYDPGTNTFTDPPEDFIDEVASQYSNIISDIASMVLLLERMSENDENPGTDYDSAYAEVDTSSLPSDFVSDIWPSIQAYLANIVGG